MLIKLIFFSILIEAISGLGNIKNNTNAKKINNLFQH